MSDGYVVAVELVVENGNLDAFMALMLDNARTSLVKEPGCRRFDVCQDTAEPERVLLYEIYDDREAFSAHLASPHYRRFDSAVSTMLAEKTVRTLTLRVD